MKIADHIALKNDINVEKKSISTLKVKYGFLVIN